MERKMHWHGLLLALTLLTIVGCSDDPDPAKPEIEPDPVTPADVYWVGTTPIEGKEYSAAVYWKNGNPVYLTDGTESVDAVSMAFAGSSVYVLGSAPYGDTYVPSYWKDGELHNVTISDNQNAHAIGVDDDDVYVAGREYDHVEESWVPRFWKNGEHLNLPDPTASVSDIVVSDGVVYTTGYQRGPNSNFIAMYWKDGVAFPLTNGTYDAEGNAIAITENGDVYVAGYETDAGGNSIPKYWKNGEEVVIDANGSVYDIVISGSGDVYLAGEIYEEGNIVKAAYWKNGTIVLLENDSEKSRAWSIAFDGVNVYTVGNTMTIGNATEKSMIWKDSSILHEYPATTNLVSVQSH